MHGENIHGDIYGEVSFVERLSLSEGTLTEVPL